MSTKKIIIADDHAMSRKGTELLLRVCYPNAQIIEAINGKDAVLKFREHMPDVILMDYNMPEMNGFEASSILLKVHKEAKIILLTMYDTLPIALNFVNIGGKGFIWKGSSNQDICDGMRAVSSGDFYFSSVIENEILRWMKSGSHKVPKIKFTPLELAIVIKLSKGKTSKEISEELKLSPRTVETYRYDLIKKTEVKNSIQLIEYVFRNGIAG